MPGEEKSNRSKADYFEVLIADKLTEYFGATRSYAVKLRELADKLGSQSLKEQKERSVITIAELVPFLKNHGITKVIKVKWIGREFRSEHTLSDVDLVLPDKSLIRLSLKSIAGDSGAGTQKNLGLESVEKYLGVDIDNELKEMWQKIRKDIANAGHTRIAALPQTQIKDLKYDHPEIAKIGKKHGLPVQTRSIVQSVKNFNALPPKGRAAFLKCIFGMEENEILINVIAHDRKVKIYFNDVYKKLMDGSHLEAKALSGKSYCITCNKKEILRIQASFTNGIGISAFCQRAFLMTLA